MYGEVWEESCGRGSVVEHLLNMHKTLGTILRTEKQKNVLEGALFTIIEGC